MCTSKICPKKLITNKKHTETDVLGKIAAHNIQTQGIERLCGMKQMQYSQRSHSKGAQHVEGQMNERHVCNGAMCVQVLTEYSRLICAMLQYLF